MPRFKGGSPYRASGLVLVAATAETRRSFNVRFGANINLADDQLVDLWSEWQRFRKARLKFLNGFTG